MIRTVPLASEDGAPSTANNSPTSGHSSAVLSNAPNTVSAPTGPIAASRAET